MIRRIARAVKRFWRSAVSGKFVSREYAEAHPETTIEERR